MYRCCRSELLHTMRRRWGDQDFVWTVLPFGWNESTYVYHSLSEAKAENLLSRGVPALAYIDDSWLGNFRDT